MKIKLTHDELNALLLQESRKSVSGGFQNYLLQLCGRVDRESGELDLDRDDFERIRRYAFAYKNGGWQGRLKKIFARTLGNDLSGPPIK